MLQEITAATRLVIVCNPNNPTSTALPLEEIAAFVRAVPRHVAVILDEAYCEFNLLQDPDESIDLLARHPNLVLLRTFSKVYGLCGLRVGYGAVRLGGLPHGGRPGAPAVLLQRRRAGRRDRGAQAPGRGRAPRRAQPRRAHGARGRAAPARASSRRSRRRTSSGSTCPRRRGGARRRRGARRARRARPLGRGARPRGRAARDGRHRGREPEVPRARSAPCSARRRPGHLGEPERVARRVAEARSRSRTAAPRAPR